MDKIWVVEMFNNELGKWEPTFDVGMTRRAARLLVWYSSDSDDKFRVREYRRW